ncbi:hypothetical protein EON65_16270 [archaeon]|nr:MAG: hypothetical protein EON65_16270 [archaeon]
MFLPGSAYKGIRQLQSRSSHPLFSLQTNVFHDLANSKCLFDLLYSQLKLSAQITGYQYGEICLYTHDSAAVHGMRANANPTLQLACSYVQEDVHGHDNYFARQANGNVHPEVITMPLAIEHREYGLLKLMKPYALSSTSNTPNAADINATLELCCESISRVLDMELRHPVLEQQLHFTLVGTCNNCYMMRCYRESCLGHTFVCVQFRFYCLLLDARIATLYCVFYHRKGKPLSMAV